VKICVGQQRFKGVPRPGKTEDAMNDGVFRRATRRGGIAGIGVAVSLSRTVMEADLEAGQVWTHAGSIGDQAAGGGRNRHALQNQGKDHGHGSKLPAH
jgi:hypothetical protein